MKSVCHKAGAFCFAKFVLSPDIDGFASYTYNGLNDRLQETINSFTTTFTMDLNMGLTQVLSDGTNSYIYGNGRIAQVNTSTEYFLGDALRSVRQLTDAGGAITYARAYDPYGVATTMSGASQTSYGYTSECNGDSMQSASSRSGICANIFRIPEVYGAQIVHVTRLYDLIRPEVWVHSFV